MTLFVKISKFLKCKIIYVLICSVSHWGVLNDNFSIT